MHGTSSVSTKNKEVYSVVSYLIFLMSFCITVLLKIKFQHVDHKCVISGLLCGSCGSTGVSCVTHFQLEYMIMAHLLAISSFSVTITCQ